MPKSIQQYDEHGEKLYPYSLTTLVFDEKGEMLEARLQAVEKLLEWFEMDNEEEMIKAKYGLYSVGAITAGAARGISSGNSASGAVMIDLGYISQVSSLTDNQVNSVGLTSEVINNLLLGKYTKVIYETPSGREVWNYSGSMLGEDIRLFFSQGDGFDIRNGISMHKSGTANWQVIYGEI